MIGPTDAGAPGTGARPLGISPAAVATAGMTFVFSVPPVLCVFFLILNYGSFMLSYAKG